MTGQSEFKAARKSGEYIAGGCQLPCVAGIGISGVKDPFVSVNTSLRRWLAWPWNKYVKQWMRAVYSATGRNGKSSGNRVAAAGFSNNPALEKGEKVRVRSLAEINETLDRFRELKGCAFLDQMIPYCGTEQTVFRVMERFFDERDYRVKKTRGMILLENNFCNGTPVFGQCDRSCFLFWREEWLERTGER